MIINSICASSKYINEYIEKEGYTELKITNNGDYNIIMKIDKEDAARCQNYFWCCSLVGTKSKSPSIYCYVNKKKMFLNRFLLKISADKKGLKIVFKNRDNLDFRKANLHIANQHQSYIKESKKGIPNGVFEYKREGEVVGYTVTYFDDKKEKQQKYFGQIKYKTLEQALKEAISFKRESLIAEGVLQS